VRYKFEALKRELAELVERWYAEGKGSECMYIVRASLSCSKQRLSLHLKYLLELRHFIPLIILYLRSKDLNLG